MTKFPKYARVKYTKEMMTEFVATSKCLSEVIRKMGLEITGGRYTHLHEIIKRYELNTDHFLGQASRKGIAPAVKLPWQDVLVFNRNKGYRTHAHILRRALIESGRKYVCEDCGIADEWNGKELVLEVDHRNSVQYDCRPENVCFRCPNCHSQKLKKNQFRRVA